jgi:hypothetical protein
MKRLLVLILLLNGCAALATENPKPPSGEQVFDILFKNADRPLTKESRCDVKSMTRKNTAVTLGQHLATILSVSYETKNLVSIKSSCEMSKDDSTGTVVDVWDCRLEMNESNQKGEFISSAMVAFNMSMDKSKLIKGSLRCF